MGMRFTGERVIPELPETRVTYLQSLAAYEQALPLVEGRRTLDVGCGEGYGVALLAERAACVVGLDNDPEAVAWAFGKYGGDVASGAGRLTFVVAGAEALPFRAGAFEAVVCFQALEHLADPVAFLGEVRRLLAPRGVFVMTTPNVLVTGARPNPHHVHDYGPAELRGLLAGAFETVDLRGVFADERVAAYRASNDRIVRRIMRVDPLGLHKRVPARALQPLHIGLTRVIRRRLNADNRALLDGLSTANFPVRAEGVEGAIDLLAICRTSG